MRKMFFRPSVSPAFPMSDKFNFFQNECFTFGLGIGCNQIIRRLLIAEGLRYWATCLLTEQLGELSAMLPHEFDNWNQAYTPSCQFIRYTNAV